MGNAIIIVGVAVGVVALVGIMVYGTAAQQDRISETLPNAPATTEGAFSSPTGLGAELNKEKWHADPFADEAAEVKAKLGL